LTSGKYFNKGVKALDSADVGHVVRETTDKIIVFGKKNEILASEIFNNFILTYIVRRSSGTFGNQNR
jgi:hypothetical protein